MPLKSWLLLLTIWLPVVAQASVKIVNVEVLESSFHGHQVRLTLDHDGSLGDDIWFGTTPLVNGSVSGFFFTPVLLRNGVFSTTVLLTRPEIPNQLSFTSYGLQVYFYNRTQSLDLRLTVPLQLEWPSLSEYYDIDTGATVGDYSVKHLDLNTGLHQFDELLEFFSSQGLSLNNVEAHIPRIHPDLLNERVQLYASEDVEFDDLINIIGFAKESGIRLSALGFYSLKDQSYPPGYVSLGIIKSDENKQLSIPEFEEVAATSSKQELFSITGFEPTSQDEFIDSTMQQAIAFVDIGNPSNAIRAKELLNTVLDKDPGNVRAYVELARAELYQRAYEGLPAARNTIQYALSLDENNPYANQYAGLIELREGNYERALEYFSHAEANLTEEITWLTVNWGDTLRMMGSPEQAKARYEQLMSLSDLDSYNANAQQTGLERYARLLEQTRDNRVIAVYERLYREYPTQSRCVPVDLSRNQVLLERNTSGAREWLELTEGLGCEDADLVNSLVRVTEWFAGNGTQPELFRAMSSTPDSGQLVYLLARMSDGEAILSRLAESGISIDEPDRWGFSPVTKALDESDYLALENLAAAGADIRTADASGFSPLLNATLNLDFRALRILLFH